MKLYILKNLTQKPKWDIMEECIVWANSPKQARELANIVRMDEGLIWSDTDKVSCKEVREPEEAMVLLASYKVG